MDKSPCMIVMGKFSPNVRWVQLITDNVRFSHSQDIKFNIIYIWISYNL